MNDTPTSAQDVVAVLKEDLTQVFELARPLKATVKRLSKIMQHPLETGAEVTDHRIILPIEIELSMVLSSEEYASVYQEIKDIFTAGTLLTVQTRVGTFPSMLIEKMPHEETAEMFDGISVALGMKEAQFVNAQFTEVKVKQKKNSSTQQRGQQQPEETPPARKGSVLSGFFK